jgi:hypothetical protein
VKFDEKVNATKMANSYVGSVSDSVGGDGSGRICGL